jgi:hypothetical protein
MIVKKEKLCFEKFNSNGAVISSSLAQKVHPHSPTLAQKVHSHSLTFTQKVHSNSLTLTQKVHSHFTHIHSHSPKKFTHTSVTFTPTRPLHCFTSTRRSASFYSRRSRIIIEQLELSFRARIPLTRFKQR